MILTLNDQLKESEYYKPVKKDQLIEKLTNAKYDYVTENGKTNYNKRTKTQELFFVEDNLSEFGQKNYLDYLMTAWDAHLGIVVNPDIILYTLMCELTSIVATHTDTYRSLFTTSNDKEEITVQSDSLTVMPLNKLMNALAEKVPSDISAFLPEFSTSTQRSILARYAAFADMVSPYYNYSMFCCGFPAIDVQGDKTDWNKLLGSWREIGKLFTKHQDYVARIESRLESVCQSIDLKAESQSDFWKKMFVLDHCGSGHQYTVAGWFNELFLQAPDLKFPENYPSHISLVKYKQLDTQKNYEMKQGLMSCARQDRFLIPDFGHIIFEKKDAQTSQVSRN